jgi:hypothetical protein
MSHTQSTKERGEPTARRARFDAAAVEVEGFRPAQWRDEAGVKRFHLDLQVDDLDEATGSVCAIGASQPDWRVLLDPVSQPLCLSPRPAAVP